MTAIFKDGQRVRFRWFENVTGTVIGNVLTDTLLPSILVKVDQAILDMKAGEVAPVALNELIPEKQ